MLALKIATISEMKPTAFPIRIPVLALVVLLIQTAAADIPLLQTTNWWRYMDTAYLDGVNWSAPNYDDSGWPTGPALFYFEDSTLVSPKNTPLAPGRTAYYFRTRISVPISVTNSTLRFTSRIDDGAVFHLDGKELMRVRMAAAPAVITSTNRATGTPISGDAYTSEALSRAGIDLSAGEHTLAVELHDAVQGGDVVFGTAMSVRLSNAPPVILAQPTSLVVEEGLRFTLGTTVDGAPTPSLQWFKDGNPRTGSTAATMTVLTARLADSGVYWLVASNQFGVLASTQAVVTVMADTNAPKVISAVAQRDLTNILVTFSEPVTSGSAGTASNYTFFRTTLPTESPRVTSVTLISPTLVSVATEGWEPGINYTLRIDGILDAAVTPNPIAPDTEVPVRFHIDLLAPSDTSAWRYWALGTHPGPAWAEPAFDDALWPSGPGLFAAGSPLPTSTDPVRTTLPLTAGTNSILTYYFRTTFDIPAILETNSVRLHQVVDDGVLYYLNGEEAYGTGVPAARPLPYDSMATINVGNAAYSPPLSSAGMALPVTALVPGLNHFAAEVHQSASGLQDASFACRLDAVVLRYLPRLRLTLPATLSEADGELTGAGEVRVDEPAARDLVIELESSLPNVIQGPQTVTIPAGATRAGCSLHVQDDHQLNGTRIATITARHPTLLAGTAQILVNDNETATLNLSAPPSAPETQRSLPIELRISTVPDIPINVRITATGPGRLTVPPAILLPRGTNRIEFQATILDNALIDGPEDVTIEAYVPGWPVATAQVRIQDDERPLVTLTLPEAISEASGVLTNGGVMSIAGTLTTNLTVTLESSGNPALNLPPTLVIPAGRSNVLFNVVISDNIEAEGDRTVTITASAPGMEGASRTLGILDNDPHHIRFSPIPEIVQSGANFGVWARAENADGSLQTRFDLRLELVAEGLDGPVGLEASRTDPFWAGQGGAEVHTTNAARVVRIRARDYPGETGPFNVILPPIYKASQMATDIAWHAASKTLFATVPAASPSYPGMLVAIDPTTGTATNAYPLAASPGRIELAAAGTHAFIAVSNDLALQRFDFTTRTTSPPFALNTPNSLVWLVTDFCVPAGHGDTVVASVMQLDQNNTALAGIWRYTSGTRSQLPKLSATGSWKVEAAAGNFEVLIAPPLVRADAMGDRLMATNLDGASATVFLKEGQVYDDLGNYYSLSTLSRLGSYPGVIDTRLGTAIPEVNPAYRRVHFLSGRIEAAHARYKLKTYDRDMQLLLSSVQIPDSYGLPLRLLVMGTNGLAYITSDGALWFVRRELTQPEAPAANLGVTMVKWPESAELGVNATFTLLLTNSGPGLASLVRLTNALPPDTTLQDATASAGSITPVDGGFTWSVAPLAAGASATLDATVQFHTAGTHCNRAWALPYEHDPSATNNVASFSVNVRLPATPTGVFVMQQAAEDMLYDADHDLLLLSIAQDPNGRSNSIARLSPRTGLIESFTPLGSQPGRMALSADHSRFYVSLPQQALVRRSDFPYLQANQYCSLGGEYINGTWYPFYAAEIAELPNDPSSIAVCRMRRPGPMAEASGAGIALVQNGILRSNTTPRAGLWSLAFDTPSDQLYAFQTTDSTPLGAVRYVYRCGLTPSGVSLGDPLALLSRTRGTGPKYAAGRFYFGGGAALTPATARVTTLYPGSLGSTLTEPDPGIGRVFFLSFEGANATLNAHDLHTSTMLGSETITNLVGTPLDLIRCGSHGLAFRTTAGLIYFVRTPLAQPTLNADLDLSTVLAHSPVTPGETVPLTLLLTNRGPGMATGVHVDATHTGPAQTLSVSCSSGSYQTNASGLVWTLTSLDAGSSATLTLQLLADSPGVVCFQAQPQADTLDPSAPRSPHLATFVVGTPSVSNPVVLPLAAHDVVWCKSLGRLLLTTQTNLLEGVAHLLSVDPSTMEVRHEAQLASGATRLHLSSDESRLFTTPAYAIEQLALPSFSRLRLDLLGDLGGWEYASDLFTLPGQPDSILILRQRSGGADLLALDATVPRNALAPFENLYYGYALTLSPDGTSLYGTRFGFGGFERFTVDSSGVTARDADSTLLPSRTPVEFEWGGGRLFTSAGIVIDPSIPARTGEIPDIPEGSVLTHDDRCGRVYAITGYANEAVLRAYDIPTLLPVGIETLPGTYGTVTRIVRWGIDGLAFLTSGGEFVLFHSGLVVSQPPADVSVAIAYHPGPPGLSLATIANHGPNPAVAVAWTNRLPAGAAVLNATASAGTITVSSNVVSGLIPAMAPGMEITAQIAFTTQGIGILTNELSATSQSVDPAFGNNRATSLMWMRNPSETNAWTLDLPIKDIERDPVRPILYASCGSSGGPLADSVIVIDPINGIISQPHFVGSNPGRIAVSADGTCLYVALDASTSIAKFSLPGFHAEGTFPIPGTQPAVNLLVSPIDPNLVLVRHTGNATCLFGNGTPRPLQVTDSDLFAFSQVSGQLFGCMSRYSNVPLNRYDTGPEGLGVLSSQPAHQAQSQDMKASGPWLVYSRGMVFNPDDAVVQCTLPLPYDAVVEPDASHDRVYAATRLGSVWTLRAFDLHQGIEVGSTPLPTLNSAPSRLLRWGSDGLALLTSNHQTILMRGTLIPAEQPADVTLRQSMSSTEIPPGGLVQASITVSNQGPGTATGVLVRQTSSLPVSCIQTQATRGTAEFNGETLTWWVDSLAPGETASCSLTLSTLRTGTLNLSAQANHRHNDGFWGDNVALSTVSVGSVTNDPRILQLAARDLRYDPSRDVLYASTPASSGLFGNLALAIDPASGAIVRAMPAGSEPNRLALTENASHLYIGADGSFNIRRLRLDTGWPDLDFALGTNDMLFAQDFVVQPGASAVVAASLGSANQSAGFPSDVYIYDAGIRRPIKSTRTASGLSFNSDGHLLFGELTVQGSQTFARMTVGPSGIEKVEAATGFTNAHGRIKFDNGRLYSTSGQVVDPYAAALLGRFPATGLLAADAGLGQVYYLGGTNGVWQLRSYDSGSFEARGTQSISGILGTPTNLVRCGADRLAFLTTSNQMFLLRSPLASSAVLAPADLGIAMHLSQDFDAPSAQIRLQVTVTNHSSSIATGTVVAIRPPAPRSGLAVQCSQGTFSESAETVVIRFGTLQPHGSATARVDVIITGTATFTSTASVSAAAIDPNPANNQSVASISGLVFPQPESITYIEEPSVAIAYDARHHRLLLLQSASGGGSRFAWMDPDSGIRMGTLDLNIPADQIALSTTDDAVYLGASAAGEIIKLSLADLSPVSRFTVPSPSHIFAMIAIPGRPGALAVAHGSFPDFTTELFVDGVPRPNRVDGILLETLETLDNGEGLLGFCGQSTGGNSPDFFRLKVSDTGIFLDDQGPSDWPPFHRQSMRYGGGFLFLDSGWVMNVANWDAQDRFALPDFGRACALIPRSGLIAFLLGDYANYYNPRVLIADMETGRSVADRTFTLPGRDFQDLAWCGGDRLVFRSTERLCFLRFNAIPSADVGLRAAASTTTLRPGQEARLSLIVTNAGPHAATNLTLTNPVPASLSISDIVSSQGTISFRDDTLIATLGTLPAGAAATFTFTYRAEFEVSTPFPLALSVGSDGIEDPVLRNNQVLVTLNILPDDADRDGMLDAWELAHGLNPMDPTDSTGDPDADGTSNLEEFRAGTDPGLFDLFRIASLRVVPAGLEFRLAVATNTPCELQSSTNLADWTSAAMFKGEGLDTTLMLPSTAPGDGARFFRLKKLPPP